MREIRVTVDKRLTLCGRGEMNNEEIYKRPNYDENLLIEQPDAKRDSHISYEIDCFEFN